jgi:hypothetical protein
MKVGFHTFPSGKKYTYIVDEHGHKVFLRNALFLSKVDDPHHIVVVREWGASSNKSVWEPPKGQMEWKELEMAGIRAGQQIQPPALLKQMRLAVQREMVEEAKILPKDVHDLKPLPIVYKQAWPESKIPGAHFMYQFWNGHITEKALKAAQDDMNKLVANPDLKHTLLHDFTEKDAVDWWSPQSGWDRIRGAFSKKMTILYYAFLKKYGL